MTHPLIWPSLARRLVELSIAGGLVCWSGVARAEEPTIDEVEYHPAELPPDAARGRVLIVGLALTAGWYGAAVGTSFLWPDAPNARDLRLPIVGPWMALGNTGCGAEESGCTTVKVVARTALAVVSGVGQAGGVVALLEGILMDTRGGAPQPKRPPKSAHEVGRERDGRASLDWMAVPVALPNGGGIEVVGRF